MDEIALLKNAAKELGITLNEEQISSFIMYKDFLINYNEKVNLTAITKPDEIILKHFADSLTVFKYINQYIKVIDVGTGAGFPSVPIKIVKPNIELTLLDSINKRIKFLDELIQKLDLKNVNCVHSRAEDAGHASDYRQKYDCAVSRAVASLSILAEYCLPFVKIGGKFISLKGPDVIEEILEAKNAIYELGGNLDEVISIKIPFTDINHSIVIISKLHDTPSVYPRKAGKVSKKPIK